MKEAKKYYVICIRAEESADIEIRKVYEVLPDDSATKRGYLRVVDETGEDYLYPKDCFATVHLPEKTIQALTPRPSKRASTGMQPTAQKTRRG